MLNELLRWQRPMTPAILAGRWTNWATELMSRHSRLEVRSTGIGMLHRLGPAPITMMRTRWEVCSQTLAPQIHLAIQPVFNQWARTVQNLSEYKVAPIAQVHSSAGNEADAISPAGSDRSGWLGRARTEPGVRQVETQSPLTRAVRRYFDETVLDRRRQTLVVEDVHRLHRRLVEERQRVETRLQPVQQEPRISEPTATSLQRAAEALVANGTNGIKRSDGSALPNGRGDSQAIANGIKPAPPMNVQPAIDIEQVTDQVLKRLDDRFIAHRERFGRIS